MGTLLVIVGWVAWALTALLCLWLGWGIRQAAVRGGHCPTWPTLSMTFCLWVLSLGFLFLPIHKAHLAWLIPALHVVGFRLLVRVSFFRVPVLSKAVVWPAYFFARLLLLGTGRGLTSPALRSPWVAQDRVCGTGEEPLDG